MPPSRKEGRPLQFSLSPSQLLHGSCLEQRSQVDGVDIAETPVLAVASSNHEDLVIDHARRMEPPCTWSNSLLLKLDLSPAQGLEVKDPEIIEIRDSFSSEDSEVRKLEFCDMIGPFPRRCLVFFGVDLDPLLGAPIKHIDGVEPLFVGSSSPEDDDLIADGVIVHGAIRAMRGSIASGLNLLPLHSDRVIRPKIVHVIGI